MKTEKALHRVPKMSEMVAADIRTKILSGAFKPGESLASESALMEEHGVLRPTLREAIRLLESKRAPKTMYAASARARCGPVAKDIAAHLKAATSHTSLASASGATQGILHHHMHSGAKAASTSTDASQSTSSTTAQTASAITAIGSIVNTKV